MQELKIYIMKIIVFLNPKGGAGKSTSSCILANTLQYHFKKNVFYISTDRQGTVPNFRKRDLLKQEGNLIENIDERFIAGEDEQYDVLATDNSYAEQNLLPDKRKIQELGIDYLIIDTPGHVDPKNFTIALEADLVLIPLKLSAPDIMDFNDLSSNIQENIYDYDKSFKNKVFCFPTEIDKRTSAFKDFAKNADAFKERYKINVLLPGVVKREDFKYIDTISFPNEKDVKTRPAMIEYTESIVEQLIK